MVRRHVKQECSTNPAYGCAPEARPFDLHIQWGVLILDKPPGLTSRQAAYRAGALVGASKVGHGGTLDPNVTGVLPVFFDRATRVAGVFLGCNKAYEGTMVLHADVSDEALAEAVAHFVGVVEQKPPVRSRVKRVVRSRRIYSFEVLERAGREARFAVRCEGGTYVRKLVHELGLKLGCGAHMASLKRLEAGGCGLAECVTIAEVEQAARDVELLRRVVLPVEKVLGRLLPAVVADDGAIHALCAGLPLAVPGIVMLDDFSDGAQVMVLTLKGELVGLGRALMSSQEVLRIDKGLAVKMETVLMPLGVYPKLLTYRPL